MSAPSARGRPVLVLLGLRCSGKSTLGRRLATELGRAFVDGDEATLAAGRQAGQRVGSAGELLARVGQATFRELESGALRRLLEPGPRIVLATGGGVVERADNRTWLARCARCVYLDVPLARLAERLRADPTPRPALLGVDPAEELGELFRRRDPLYRALAELVLACDDDPPKTLAARVLAELGAL